MGGLKKKWITVLTIVVTTVTTATLDWAFAKVQSYTVDIPIITPIGTLTQQIELEERRGFITGRKYK